MLIITMPHIFWQMGVIHTSSGTIVRKQTRRRTATTSKLKRSPSLFFEINTNREVFNYAV